MSREQLMLLRQVQEHRQRMRRMAEQVAYEPDPGDGGGWPHISLGCGDYRQDIDLRITPDVPA